MVHNSSQHVFLPVIYYIYFIHIILIYSKAIFVSSFLRFITYFSNVFLNCVVQFSDTNDHISCFMRFKTTHIIYERNLALITLWTCLIGQQNGYYVVCLVFADYLFELKRLFNRRACTVQCKIMEDSLVGCLNITVFCFF